MKAIHNYGEAIERYNNVVVNIVKSKNESNSQLEEESLSDVASCCKYR